MNIFFLSDKELPNYTEDSDFYSYMSFYDIKNHDIRKKLFEFSCTGKYIHTNYLYWLCRNNGINVKLVNNTQFLPKKSVVFFHYDMQHLITDFKNFYTVQILSDRPIIPNVDFYTSCSKQFVSSNKLKNCFYLPEPLPAKNLISLPNINTSAKTFRFLGLRKNFPEFLNDDLIEDLKKKNIFIKKEFSKNFVEAEDDVIFFLRKEQDLLYNKHVNRVFLSYLNESPYIGNLNIDEKSFLVKKDDAINIDYNKDSLIDAMIYLKNSNNYLKYKLNLKTGKDSFRHHWVTSMRSLISSINSQIQ